MTRPSQSQSNYGLPEPLQRNFPAPIIATRAPTTADTGYALGQQWIDKSAGAGYILVKIAGTATWVNQGSGGSPLNTINSENPVANNIDLINQGGLGGMVITAPGSGGAGTIGLGVNVDGVTITINGSNQLVASAASLAISPDTGVNVTNFTYSLLGTQVAAGTNPVRTNGTAANSMQIEVQRSQAVATSTLANNGICHFDSADFTVDANGFVSLIGASPIVGTTTTVGAVTADILTIAGGAVAGMYQLEAELACFESSGPGGGWYSMSGGFRTTGAATTKVGTEDRENGEDAALSGANVTYVASGNNMIVRVLGVAGLTINWRAEAYATFVS